MTNYEAAQRADHERYARFFHALLDRDIFFAPSGYETLFVSLAHTDEVIDQTIAAAEEALGGLRLRRVVVLRQTVPPHVVHEEE